MSLFFLCAVVTYRINLIRSNFSHFPPSTFLLPSPLSRQLWRLLLRRTQEVLGRGDSAAAGDPSTTTAREEETAAAANLLSRGMIPLPLLDDVMGFDADEALRARRQLQQQEAVSIFFVGRVFMPATCKGWLKKMSTILLLWWDWCMWPALLL